MLMIRVPVEAPPPAQSRRGLLLSAPEWPTPAASPTAGRESATPAGVPRVNGGVPGDAWMAGFTFEPRTCEPVAGGVIECIPETEKDFSAEHAPLVHYDPYLLLGTDRCSTVDRTRDRVGRARDQLVASRSWFMERELWEGTIAGDPTAGGSPNPRFVNNPDVVDGGTGPAENVTVGSDLPLARALAVLEREAADCLHGQRAVIHASPELATMWQAAHLLDVEGSNLVTVMGSLVVAGAGYTGTGPTGQAPGTDTTWAYATGMVYQRTSAIAEYADPADRIDWRNNDEAVLVEQTVAATWAGCCLLAVNVDLTTIS